MNIRLVNEKALEIPRRRPRGLENDPLIKERIKWEDAMRRIHDMEKVKQEII